MSTQPKIAKPRGNKTWDEFSRDTVRRMMRDPSVKWSDVHREVLRNFVVLDEHGNPVKPKR